jgi:hypothetical protein
MALIRGLLAAVLTVTATTLLTPSAPRAATPSPAREHDVKAAFLYHFSQLVDWPAGAASPSEPFVIAVVGPDPFGTALDQALGGKSVRSQPLQLKRFASVGDLAGARVHVLFVGGSDPGFQARALEAVAGQPVLVVGETPGFAERGGTIGFRVTPEGRVGFDINARRAEQAGLRMSSQLLKLARIVGPGPR